MNRPEIAEFEIIKINDSMQSNAMDALAIEEPLQISICDNFRDKKVTKSVAVTMRTPGNDAELALGFLLTEGILDKSMKQVNFKQESWSENTIDIEIPNLMEDKLHSLERNFYTTSSCGVCGKASIDAIRTNCKAVSWYSNEQIDISTILALPSITRKQQDVFENTGGLHASALFSNEGEFIFLKEDVGRHNALDKLIGAAYRKGILPLNKHILLLSGRASFELIQKAAMAGIAIVAAVGAPSSLAVKLADELNLTLIGFLRDQRFNIYTHSNRIKL